MTPRIQKAIDIFLDAINTGNLAKGICSKCAVGNLCGGSFYWGKLFHTVDGYQIIVDEKTIYKRYAELAKKDIEKTDFSLKELMRIEQAFECNTRIHCSDYDKCSKEEILKDQVAGLKAVIEVMMTFDDVKVDIQKEFVDKVLVTV
jgi:hypothetical protein